MGSHRSEHILVIDASREICFDLLADHENLHEWQEAVVSAEVLETDKKSGSQLVDTLVDVKVKKIRYLMRYHYDRPNRLWWDYLEGDVKSIDGEYIFHEREDGMTEIHYTLEIDPGRFVPGPIKKILTDQALKTALQELKDQAESLSE